MSQKDKIFTHPKWSFWEYNPKMGSSISATPKGISLRENTSYDA